MKLVVLRLINLDGATNSTSLCSSKAVLLNFSHPFVVANDDINLVVPTSITAVFLGSAQKTEI